MDGDLVAGAEKCSVFSRGDGGAFDQVAFLLIEFADASPRAVGGLEVVWKAAGGAVLRASQGAGAGLAEVVVDALAFATEVDGDLVAGAETCGVFGGGDGVAFDQVTLAEGELIFHTYTFSFWPGGDSELSVETVEIGACKVALTEAVVNTLALSPEVNGDLGCRAETCRVFGSGDGGAVELTAEAVVDTLTFSSEVDCNLGAGTEACGCFSIGDSIAFNKVLPVKTIVLGRDGNVTFRRTNGTSTIAFV